MPDSSVLTQQTLRYLIATEKVCRATGALYRFDRFAGEGQTGAVIKATRRDENGHSAQTVALKILKDLDAVTRLRREFDLLNSIRSVHCANVLGWETFDFGPAIVFEWIDGLNLIDAARAGLLTHDSTETIVAQIQNGLRALHANGLFHGDLAPSNILIDRSGTIRLVDFGGAPETKEEIIGTPAYLAPERWKGAPCSREADLFALGLILRDLESNFERLSESFEECRLQSEARIESDCDLLHEDPAMRKFLDVEADLAQQECLAEAVRRFLDSKSAACFQTRVIGISKSGRSRFQKAAASIIPLIFLSPLISLRANAPIAEKGLPSRSRLLITSQRWLRLSINGKDVGYAPIVIDQLWPGFHRIAWRRAGREGQTRLRLKEGQTLRLTDRDLSQLE